MELVDLYNNKRELLGKTSQRGKLKDGEYSLSVHVWILDNEKVWMQKRSKTKRMFPNLWEQSGGGVISGESSINAVIRETKEEIGIDLLYNEIKYIGSYTRVKDIVDVWLVEKKIMKSDIILQEDEVEDIQLLSFEQVDKLIKQGNVVPTIEPSYSLVKNYYSKYMKGKLI